MINQEIQHKIKELQLYTKRLARVNFFGTTRSTLKGSGLEFDQLRDYQSGDDVRALDWKSSARINKLLVKQFHEEKHRTIIIALDISSSVFFGSSTVLKHDILARIAAIVSYAAHTAKDEIGLILFTHRVELYIPPRKGKAHVTLILEKIFAAQQKSARTNIGAVLDYVAQLRKKNAMVFMISDFIDTDFAHKFGVAARLYDLICIRMLDTFEKNFPRCGLLTVRDSETNQEYILNTRTQAVQKSLQNRIEQQTRDCMLSRIGMLDITYDCDVIDRLTEFFKIRKR